MADTLDFTPPKDWNTVYGELKSGYDRTELLGFAKLFVLSDDNGDGVIDEFELKLAQEKMDAKTHTEMRGYLAAMKKAGREAKLSFRDFVQLHSLIEHRQLVWAGGRAGFIPPVEESGLKEAPDQSSTGKKKFFEQLAAEKAAVVDREMKLKQPSAAEARRKAKEEEEARAKAKEQKDAEEKERRRQFAAKQRAQFEAEPK